MVGILENKQTFSSLQDERGERRKCWTFVMVLLSSKTYFDSKDCSQLLKVPPPTQRARVLTKSMKTGLLETFKFQNVAANNPLGVFQKKLPEVVRRPKSDTT